MSYETSADERKQVAKAWGLEEYLADTPFYTAKFLWITPGMQCSLHFHDIKNETFIAMDGLTQVEYWVDNKRYETILVGWRRDALNVPAKTPHRFWSIGGQGSLVLEVSTPHNDADVTRIEESKPVPEDDAGA
jgi:mannose-6-phosphate isomerase-like protein (cupin superfamily)